MAVAYYLSYGSWLTPIYSDEREPTRGDPPMKYIVTGKGTWRPVSDISSPLSPDDVEVSVEPPMVSLMPPLDPPTLNIDGVQVKAWDKLEIPLIRDGDPLPVADTLVFVCESSTRPCGFYKVIKVTTTDDFDPGITTTEEVYLVPIMMKINN